jgi:hypothetical protein
MIKEIGVLLERKTNGSPLAILLLVFLFLMIIIFSMFRYGQIAQLSLAKLRAQSVFQVWMSWAAVLASASAAGWLKIQVV